MSLATIGNQRSTRGQLYVPSYGAWTAYVHTDNETLLSGVATVSIGDLTMTGTIVPGQSGISASEGYYAVQGGIAWETRIGQRAYQTDASSGVRLKTILRDIAQDAGVDVATVDFPPDVRAGSSWERLPGLARSALDVLRDSGLAPPWYLTPAGRTVFAARATGEIREGARVKRRSLDLGIRYLQVDSYAPWVPGLSFEGATIGAVRFRWTSETATVELHP